MAEKDNGSEVSTELPKLLLELVNQIDEKDNSETNIYDQTTSNDETASETKGCLF